MLSSISMHMNVSSHVVGTQGDQPVNGVVQDMPYTADDEVNV